MGNQNPFKGKKKSNLNNEYYIRLDKQTLETTGEIRIAEGASPLPVVEREEPIKRGGFEIAYMSALLDVFDKLGNKKIQVLKYILAHKDGMNTLNITNTELAEKCGVARQTVVDTIKLLTDADILVRKGTVLRLSPRLVVRGDYNKEMGILRRFAEEQAEVGRQGTIIELNVGEQ